MTVALEVRELHVTYDGPPAVHAVNGVSLTIDAGECLGILGESGSGKSSLVQALLGLLSGATVEGSVRVGDAQIRVDDESAWQAVRWRRISLALQSLNALNPVLTVGDQLTEPMRVHLGSSERSARRRACELLRDVGLDEGALVRYPRELSGGQKRLVMIAMALACDPEVVVLDEPTAGLDPVTRDRVLDLLSTVRTSRNAAILVVSHDAEALERVADRVAVLYRGWLAEEGPSGRVVNNPRHPYSFGLLNSRPTLASLKDLRGIRGDPPRPTEVASGCPFLERCTQVVEACGLGRPPVTVPTGEDGRRTVGCVRGGVAAVMEVAGLSKTFRVGSTLFKRRSLVAADGIHFTVREGEVLGLVGPTGAGKSTIGKMLVRLLDPDGGTISFEGRDLLAATGDELKALRRHVQLLFQDPYEALSPRMTVAEVVREPLDIHRIGTSEERQRLVRTTLADCRLPSDDDFCRRRTHELSGGQLQRVALARALVLEPKLLIADEPVAMLDPSEQAKVLQLLKALQVQRGMAMILVSHELAIVLRVADRVMVLDHGRVIEEGTGTTLFVAPRHPVTRALLAASGRDAIFRESPAGVPLAVGAGWASDTDLLDTHLLEGDVSTPGGDPRHEQGGDEMSDSIDEVVGFHGHQCGGLAIGIQASRIALREIGPHAKDEEVVAVVETDMCAVDAIQAMTGCTFGKGNLIHRDWGKNAYTFYRRSDSRAIRIAPRPVLQADSEQVELRSKVARGEATADEAKRAAELHEAWVKAILDASPDELFTVTEVHGEPPRQARLLASVTCAECAEPTMETRVRVLSGRHLCIPCYEAAYSTV